MDKQAAARGAGGKTKAGIGAVALTLTLALAAPVAAQEPYDRTWCEILAHIGFDAAEMRQDGLSQQQVAANLADLISEAAGATPGPLQARRDAAALLGAASTQILRFVYTVPMGPEEQPFPFQVGAFIYGLCASGEI